MSTTSTPTTTATPTIAAKPASTPDPELSLLGNLACLIDGVRSGVETYAADYALDAPESASDEEIDAICEEAKLALMRGLGEYLLAATSIDDLDIEVALTRLGIADRIAA